MTYNTISLAQGLVVWRRSNDDKYFNGSVKAMQSFTKKKLEQKKTNGQGMAWTSQKNIST